MDPNYTGKRRESFAANPKAFSAETRKLQASEVSEPAKEKVSMDVEGEMNTEITAGGSEGRGREHITRKKKAEETETV